LTKELKFIKNLISLAMNNKFSRREFLKTIPLWGLNGAFSLKKWDLEGLRQFFPETTAVKREILNKERVNEIRNFCNQYGTPYNSNLFEAGERIIFKGTEPYLSLITRDNVFLPSLTIKFTDAEISLNRKEKRFFNLNGTIEIPLGDSFPWKPKILKYKLIYKTPDNKTEETCYRYVRTPFCQLKDGPIKIIVFSDTHLPDDRNFTRQQLTIPEIFDLRTNGEYVNRIFLKKLASNPSYLPSGDEIYLMNGFNVANAIWYILNNEEPDFFINLGDDHGGFGHTWESLGLPNQHLATELELDAITRMFRLAQRKIYSALMSHIPCYYVLGNHDGENGWSRMLPYAMKWRKRYLPLPGAKEGGSPDENYYPIIWGCQERVNSLAPQPPEITCLVLDVTRYNVNQPLIPENWTSGKEQLKWLEEKLNEAALFRFIFTHHIFGGWPTQSDCRLDSPHTYAYGRGIGFTREYYEDLNRFLEASGYSFLKVNPEKIEQIYKTNLFLKKGVDAIVYGHDHIFKGRKIGRCENGRDLHAICAGATKNLAEISWFIQPLFIRDYGRHDKMEFFSCPGYLVIEIAEGGINFYYKKAGAAFLSYPNSNLPLTAKTGDIISAYMI